MEDSLTPRQHALLTYLRQHAAVHDGISPSYRETATALGTQSKSHIGRLLASLHEQGKIKWRPRRARSVEVIA